MECPSCRGWLDDAPDLAGTMVRCPFCNGLFHMPDTSAPRFVTSGRLAKRGGPEHMLAAMLSLVIPGLGQLCQGRMGWAVFWFVMAVIGVLLIPVLVGIPLLILTVLFSVMDAARWDGK